MKREGRQHGMVRTYPILSRPWNPRPARSSRNLNELSSPPTAGIFTRAPSRPTNHSKFTGKCGRVQCRDCHMHPACKSKEKAKGAQKSRLASDTMSSYRLITWRVVDAAPGFKFSGFSASGVLDYLGNEDYRYNMDMDHDCEPDYDDDDGDHRFGSRGGVEIEIDELGVEDCEADAHNHNHKDNDDEDTMSFCEVGFVWEPVDGDESWCIVEEM